MLDNIGLPYSGINIALSDSATVGPMDGEILISLKEKHTPTAAHVADLRRELPRQFPEMQFFFQPADIVNQVLNFGQPAPIDIRVTGPHSDADYATGRQDPGTICSTVPGMVDAHIFQVPDAPSMKIDVDRTLASEMGMTPARRRRQRAGHAQLQRAWSPRTSGSTRATTSAIRWSCRRRHIASNRMPRPADHAAGDRQRDARRPAADERRPGSARGTVPMVMSQLNIRPVFDVHADVQGSDLGSVADGDRRR